MPDMLRRINHAVKHGAGARENMERAMVAAYSAGNAPIVEAGTGQITVTISGSVQYY
ncbi:MAG: hypothetical protein HYY48_02910 [Gammaproteobacteria bacterium]|nr:hypothetical protein [Gammaproteobacteria bacterium]